MKRLVIGILAAVAGLSISSAGAKTLRLGDFMSPKHIISVQGTQIWMKDVEKLTDGKIKFEYFPAEQAAKATALLDAVKNGILDAALIGPIYNSETLPLNSVVGLPGFFTSAEQGTVALQKMMAKGPLRQELLNAGVEPIYSFVLPPYQVLSKDKRLGGPADWKGLNIRTAGASQAITARDLGGTGVSIPGPEVYTAVERGRLDAVLFPLSSVSAYHLQEVVKYISTNGSLGGYSFVLVVNKDLYNGLSQSEKDAMKKAGQEVAIHVAKAQDDSVGAQTKEWAAKGIHIYQFTDQERAAINKDISSVGEEWLKRIGARNPKAGEVLSTYKALMKE